MNKIYNHCIDPGHGGTDPGAVGKRKTHESDIVLQMSKIMVRILIEQGQKAVLTRNKDVFLTLAERSDIANINKCDIFVSIHCNSAVDPQAHGIETYLFPKSIEGAKLAKLVEAELKTATGLTDRGIKEANFGVLRMSKMVSILVETAFISNDQEEILLMQSEYREKVVLAIVKGIFKYLGLVYISKPLPAGTTTVPVYKIVAATVLNVRSGQGINFEDIGDLKKGEKVQVYKTYTTGWTQILFGKTGGYVKTEFIK